MIDEGKSIRHGVVFMKVLGGEKTL